MLYPGEPTSDRVSRLRSLHDGTTRAKIPVRSFARCSSTQAGPRRRHRNRGSPMTAISYPDCTATSPNGKFTLEARSPDNGTINHRNGRSPSENDFAFKYRQHQDEFRYRLIDNTRRPLLGRLTG